MEQQYLSEDRIQGIFCSEMLQIVNDSGELNATIGIKRNLEFKQRAIKVIKAFERKLLSHTNKRFPHDNHLPTFSMFYY